MEAEAPGAAVVAAPAAPVAAQPETCRPATPIIIEGEQNLPVAPDVWGDQGGIGLSPGDPPCGGQEEGRGAWRCAPLLRVGKRNR